MAHAMAAQQDKLTLYRLYTWHSPLHVQVFLCCDLWKDRAMLHAAYCDSQGITERFIKNGMAHAMAALDCADRADPHSWVYDVVVNPNTRQVRAVCLMPLARWQYRTYTQELLVERLSQKGASSSAAKGCVDRADPHSWVYDVVVNPNTRQVRFVCSMPVPCRRCYRTTMATACGHCQTIRHVAYEVWLHWALPAEPYPTGRDEPQTHACLRD